MREVQVAARTLESKGTTVRVVSVHTLKPLDAAVILQAARETGAVVTVEEHTIHGGLGGAVAETLLDGGVMPRRFLRIALEQGFSSIVGSQVYLRGCYHMDAPQIAARIEKLLHS